MEMRLDHFCDREAMCLCVSEILVDIALRVDDNGAASGFIANQVARVGKASEVVLLEEHGDSICLHCRILMIPYGVCVNKHRAKNAVARHGPDVELMSNRCLETCRNRSAASAMQRAA